jgi:hypothetical protein
VGEGIKEGGLESYSHLLNSPYAIPLTCNVEQVKTNLALNLAQLVAPVSKFLH